MWGRMAFAVRHFLGHKSGVEVRWRFLNCRDFPGVQGSVKFNIVKGETEKVKSGLWAEFKRPLNHPKVSVPSYVPGTVLGDPGTHR